MRSLFGTLLSALLIAILVTGCEPPPPLHQQQLVVFGTLVDISIWGVDAERAEQAIAQIDREFQQMHRDWHAWEPGPLTEINAALAAGESATVLPSLLPIIERSMGLYQRSDGLFNPAIGRLLQLWGFQGNGKPNRPPPDRAAVAKLVSAAPGMDALTLNGDHLTSSNPAVQLDFGAFAKGYAVDIAIGHLRQMGIDNAIVNAGGDLRAIGSKGGTPWRVGIRHPQGEGVLASVTVSGDESVFTSGNYERFNEYQGVRYNHILDPRSGYPVNDITSVTVIHPDGADADATATALVVAGVEGWRRIANQLGIHYVMLVDGTGTVYLNPAMAARLAFQSGSELKTVILPLAGEQAALD